MIEQLFKKLKNLLFPKFIYNAGKYKTYRLEVSGLKLNYAKVGKGSPLVFIHGWANNWEGWIPIITYLKKSHTLYILDLPGFGDSDDFPKYSIEKTADIVSLFLKALPQKPDAVIGLSMGSYVVGELAYKYHKYIKNAVLIGPVLKDGNRNILASFMKIFLKTVSKSFLSEKALKKIVETRMAAYLISKYVNMYKFRRDLVDAYGMIGKKKMRKKAFVDMGISAASYNLKEKLLKVSVPTLLIYGKQDKITSSKFAKESIIPENPKLSYVVISRAGHVVPWEKPKEVADAIKKFITSQRE